MSWGREGVKTSGGCIAEGCKKNGLVPRQQGFDKSVTKGFAIGKVLHLHAKCAKVAIDINNVRAENTNLLITVHQFLLEMKAHLSGIFSDVIYTFAT